MVKSIVTRTVYFFFERFFLGRFISNLRMPTWLPLVLANIINLATIFLFGWNIVDVAILIWIENLIYVTLVLFSLLINKPSLAKTAGFVAFYGFWFALLGIFLLVLVEESSFLNLTGLIQLTVIVSLFLGNYLFAFLYRYYRVLQSLSKNIESYHDEIIPKIIVMAFFSMSSFTVLSPEIPTMLIATFLVGINLYLDLFTHFLKWFHNRR
ncbi:MAG: DUF6498-containing protein [Candidatus Dojkabacteria bacterium]